MITMSNILEVEAANFMAFVGARPPRPDSIFILVMGMTGSGKSSFIADCTGRKDVEIGHDLESCTNSVAIFRENLNGRDVYLIDTPGFDDTNKEDVEILTAVAHYLSVSYANNVSVNGILYLHRISDTRIGSSTRRNLEMMKALCGEDAFENVAVVTTMWRADDSEPELAKQRAREQELQDVYLHDMATRGSQIIRHDRCNTLSERRTSARGIFLRMVALWQDTQVTLQIQYEMVDCNMTLKETSAGQVLEKYIRQDQNSCQSDLERPDTSPSNLTYHDTHEVQLRALAHIQPDAPSNEIQMLLAENNRALEAMRLSLVEIHARQEQKFLSRVSVMENEWKEALRWREEEYRLKELEYRKRQREQESHLRRLDSRTRRVEERERDLEERRAKTLQLEASSNSATEKELERLRLEVEKLRLETASKLDTTERARHEWKGPLLQGLATGGLGIVGSLITAGMLCCVQ
ncbi:P-loop containing nucleoside triphosphate hydrolase protein [Nemania sp. NC0429]|nr:P-loop containing nucleoside triphosphate hydrolase protein [Nemania sp. NC0429]